MGTPSATGWEGMLPPGVRPLTEDDPVRLGGHALIGRLGSGGMGVVYLGQDPAGNHVAIKAARAGADEETISRFEAEAACLRRAPQACTTRLVADGSGRRPPYIVTEYVEGRSVEHVVETGGPLQPEQVTALATGVGRALAAIHEVGLIHRDLKPGNILLTPTGPRVIDFGISQQVGAAGGPTGPGSVVGSPGWIPPERLNHYPASPASDVFGWGCLVAYAATGRNPFGKGDAEEVVRRTLREPPDLDGIESPLRELVAKALSKEPAERPSASWILSRLVPGSEDMARYPEPSTLLLPAAYEPESEHSGTRVAPVTILRSRRRQALAGAAVTAVVLLAVVVATSSGDDTPQTPPAVSPTAGPPAPVARPRSTPHDQTGASMADQPRPTRHYGHGGKHGGRVRGGGGKGGHGHG